MSRICTLSGKGSMVGNRVSHANNKTKVRLLANLQDKRIYVPSLGRFVRVRLSASALRTVNRVGIEAYASKVGIKLA
jgi:large subunit ribosomal protein L28